MGTRDLPNIYTQIQGPLAQGCRQTNPECPYYSDIYHFRHSIKNLPNLKVTARFLYTVIDAKCDGGMLFLAFLCSIHFNYGIIKPLIKHLY